MTCSTLHMYSTAKRRLEIIKGVIGQLCFLLHETLYFYTTLGSAWMHLGRLCFASFFVMIHYILLQIVRHYILFHADREKMSISQKPSYSFTLAWIYKLLSFTHNATLKISSFNLCHNFLQFSINLQHGHLLFIWGIVFVFVYALTSCKQP